MVGGPEGFDDMLELVAFRSQVTGRVPSVSELATLAAMLLARKNIQPQDLPLAVKQALGLWESSYDAREEEIDRLARLERYYSKVRANITFPMPKTYPVTLDVFLRLLIKGNKKRREKIYLRYVKEMIEIKHLRELIYPQNPALALPEEEALKRVPTATQPEIDLWIT